MRIVARAVLKRFWEKHQDPEQPLRAWFSEAKRATWQGPNEIKQQYKSASVVGGRRVVFDIAGNKYRLIASINYETQIVYIRFIGTHRQYDKIDAENI